MDFAEARFLVGFRLCARDSPLFFGISFSGVGGPAKAPAKICFSLSLLALMASRDRGRKKPKLRDYSAKMLTVEEAEALSNSFAAQKEPTTNAILGAVMVEHQLDILLRRKFNRKDEETWELLVSERGPLSSFYSKIITGFAFKLYDEKTQHDLHVIREIRNAFAHSRKLLNFSDDLIVDKLKTSKLLGKQHKTSLEFTEMARKTYVILCFNVVLKLLRWHSRAQKAANRRTLKKLGRLPAANVLFSSLGSSLSGFPKATELSQLHPPDSQNENPKPSFHGLGLLGQALQQAKSDDKTDN